jgi:hypothetical protein
MYIDQSPQTKFKKSVDRRRGHCMADSISFYESQAYKLNIEVGIYILYSYGNEWYISLEMMHVHIIMQV